MRVMIFVKATEESETGVMPTADEFAAMGKFNEALVDAGIMEDGDGLRPSSAARRVVFDGDERTVVDGPFPVNEVVAGYWLWNVRDIDEATEWVKRCPNPMRSRSEIEIRPFFDMTDFEGLLPADQIADEARLRDRIAHEGSARK